MHTNVRNLEGIDVEIYECKKEEEVPIERKKKSINRVKMQLIKYMKKKIKGETLNSNRRWATNNIFHNLKINSNL